MRQNCRCGKEADQAMMMKFGDYWYCCTKCVIKYGRAHEVPEKEDTSCPSPNEPPDGSIYL